MGTEIFKIDASWAEKLTKTRVQFLLAPTVFTCLSQETRGSPLKPSTQLQMGRWFLTWHGLDYIYTKYLIRLDCILDIISCARDLALGVLAAGADAGVLAVVVEACEAGGALPVILTVALPATGESYSIIFIVIIIRIFVDPPALHEGVPLVPCWAPAGGGVPCGHAVRPRAAGVRVTRVRLLLAASDGVGGGHVAGHTLCKIIFYLHLNIFNYCKNIFYFCKNIFSFYKNIFYFYKNIFYFYNNIFYFYENISDLTHGVAEPVDVALGVGAAGAGEAGVGGRRAGLHVAAARDGVGLGLVAGQTRAHRVT